MKKLKWGVIGAGKIAGRFLKDLSLEADAQVTGIASRSFQKAKTLADLYGATAYESTESLFHSDIDIIYVATPHTRHFQDALAGLNAKKAVLCEKPFTLNFAEAEKLANFASSMNVFIMEAMWSRFFPAIVEVLDIVESGKLGELLSIESSFGTESPYEPLSRAYDPNLGGGSLLDVGVYSISLAQMLFGQEPAGFTSSAEITPTGVDGFAKWALDFGSGRTAIGSSAVNKVLANEAVINGSRGKIQIPRFWCPKEFSLNGTVYRQDFPGEGFQFEAREVVRCLRSGQRESKMIPLSFSLGVMRTMDRIRRHWGLVYPGE